MVRRVHHPLKRFLIFFLIFVGSALFANMAKPWVDGSTHSVVFTKTEGKVRREKINIEIVEKGDVFYAKYDIAYDLFCEKEIEMPLRFIGLGLDGKPAVIVNSETVSTTHPVSSFDAILDRPGVVLKPSDEFVFTAKLRAGINRIQIIYDANVEYGLRENVRKYTLRYALYPSKFWTSFGPVDIALRLPSDTEFTTSNIGTPKSNGQLLGWTINASVVDELQISFSRKQSFLSEIMEFLRPSGMASIVFIALGFLNVRLLRSYPKYSRLIFWIGILVVPAAFYFIFIESRSWIDAMLRQHQNHGYFTLTIVTWPILMLLYALYLLAKKKKIDKANVRQ